MDLLLKDRTLSAVTLCAILLFVSQKEEDLHTYLPGPQGAEVSLELERQGARYRIWLIRCANNVLVPTFEQGITGYFFCQDGWRDEQ